MDFQAQQARVAKVSARLRGRSIFGRWNDYGEMRESWFESTYEDKEKEYPADFPEWHEVIFASYGGGAYEGDAVVIYSKGGKLFEVNGSHCSCHGLETQWKPEATTVEALAMRDRDSFLSEHEQEAKDAYERLVDSLQTLKRLQ